MKRKILVWVVMLCMVLAVVPVAVAADAPLLIMPAPATAPPVADWAYYVDDWYSSSDREEVQAVLDAFYGTLTTVPGQPLIKGEGMDAAVYDYAAAVDYTLESDIDGNNPLNMVHMVVDENAAAEDVTIAVLPHFDFEINGYSADFTNGFKMESVSLRIESMVRPIATVLTPAELAAGAKPQVYFDNGVEVPDSVELNWAEELVIEGDLQISFAIPAGLTAADTLPVVLENEKGNYLYEATVDHQAAYSMVSFTSTDGVGTFSLIFDEDCVPDDSYFGAAEEQCVCTMFYVDINTGGWYHDAVEYAIYNNIMSGNGDKFMPTFNVTRAMMAQMLYNAEGMPEAAAPALDDVSADMWYSNAVGWAAETKVFEGYEAAVFGPEKVLTREHAAIFLYNYAKYKGYDVSVGEETNILSYEDAFDISEGAYEAIQWAMGSGVMNGKPGNIIDPHGSLTRAEAAQLMMNFSEKYVNEF